MTLRICLIGPGDFMKNHYSNILGISNNKLRREIKGIAKLLSRRSFEIVLVPDKGIPLEIAKLYKKYGGRKVIGLVPFSDKTYGINHLKPYMKIKVNGKKLFDEFIDTENWYKQDVICCTFGDIILMLGYSLGSVGELVYGFYIFKLLKGGKAEIIVSNEKIHKEVRAGKRVPYSVLIYRPFVKGKLNYEIEKYIKTLGGQILYAKNLKDLDRILKSFLELAPI